MKTVLTPILQTKLQIPPVQPHWLSREKLIERLNKRLNITRLLLLNAPAGYGKSTLLSLWVSQRPEKIAWLSLSESDNEVGRFFRYLLAAIQTTTPSFGSATADLLQLPQGAPLEGLLVTLINELDALSQPLILVLDDFHLLTAAPLIEALQFLIHHLPAAMHLVIATRTDLPVSLIKLRAKQQLLELTAADLQLNQPETKDFVNTVAQLNLPDNQLMRLQQQSEGWLAGLQLVTLALRNAPSQLEGGQSLSHTRHVFEFLAEEVLGQQPAAVQTFLKCTAVLERFCAPLADHLLGCDNSRIQLAQIQQDNLFLIALDERGEWYRYHHLFTDFLRSRVDKALQQRLFEQAAVWHAAHGSPEEAIPYALAAGKYELVSQLLITLTPAALNQGQIMTILAWINQLPPPYVRQNFELTVFRGYIASLQGDVAAAEMFCQQAAALLPSAATAIQQGYLLALQATVATDKYEVNNGLEYSREALLYIPEDDPFFHTYTLLILSGIQANLGDYEAAIETQRRVLKLSRRHNSRVTEMGAIGILGHLLYQRGQRRAAAQLCHEVVDQYEGKLPPPTTGLAFVVLGFTYLTTNQLDQAKKYLQQGVDLCTQLGFLDFMIMGNSALAQLYLAQGDLNSMWRLLEGLRQTAMHPYARKTVEALEARVQWQLGNLDALGRWVQANPIDPHQGINAAHLSWYDLHVQWLLNQNHTATAKLVLDNCEKFAKQKGLFSNLIRFYLLQAKLALQEQQPGQAVEAVGAALALAAVENIVTPFLQISADVQQLYTHFRPQYPQFVPQIRPEEQTPAPPADKTAATAGASLTEELSERELEILRLIAQGLSNRDIANQLVITLGTTKWHVHNILSKLDVKRRTQAVAKAQQLNWI